ncbi:hypothetical protein OF897_13940 [Chryseobacterium formosus]|uniref:Tissue inhibitor of metalloproteinase n=1 Tax=Chryseobacterium formosus TaxID=1537363 RepID=A0ABT3XT99_9FLAO|nr:hypothetical protein [Chryseobacterium formosus]MCX8525016.1 hypothetical protein [Chryseobacterium formosus]
MNKTILILFLFIFKLGYSCVCSYSPEIFNTYSKADLVADITITNVRPSDNKNLSAKYYMVDVKYNTVYKGKKIESFYVYGSKLIGKKYYGSMTSCSLGLNKGDRLIIFHNLDKIQSLHYCSPRIVEKYKMKFLESKKILEDLSNLSIQTNFKNFIIDTKFDSKTGKNELNQFDGIKAKNSFALLEITLNTDGTFKNVDYIKKLDSNYDEKILQYFQTSKLLYPEKFKFSDGEKFVLPIHYIKDEKNKTYISLYFY